VPRHDLALQSSSSGLSVWVGLSSGHVEVIVLDVLLVQWGVEIHELDDGNLGLLLVGEFDGVDHIWQEEASEVESLLIPHIWTVLEDTALHLVTLAHVSYEFVGLHAVLDSQSVVDA
jgi:hypothetical protein